MKSQIFKTAWELVKSSGMNLSNALKVSWAEFKADAMARIYNESGCNDFKLGKKLDVLIGNLNRIKPCLFIYNSEKKALNNDGAKWDYGFGLYNGD